jgi:hypothetical protein
MTVSKWSCSTSKASELVSIYSAASVVLGLMTTTQRDIVTYRGCLWLFDFMIKLSE